MTGMRAIAYMRTHLGQPLTTSAVARALEVSPRTLHRVVSAHAGVPPVKALAMLRVAEAQRLLADGVKVDAVALMVGYRTRASLYRQVRSLTGRTVADCRGQGRATSRGACAPRQPALLSNDAGSLPTA
jgi:transcriptional regulator GlxA family with amidase domain